LSGSSHRQPIELPVWRPKTLSWGNLDRTACFLMGQARSEEERTFVERLYDEALEEGPDFTHYRSKSAFMDATKLGIDRNAYARILHYLDRIERGTYEHNRKKGEQRIPRRAGSQMPSQSCLALW
jgi:hypothetical protein